MKKQPHKQKQHKQTPLFSYFMERWVLWSSLERSNPGLEKKYIFERRDQIRFLQKFYHDWREKRFVKTKHKPFYFTEHFSRLWCPNASFFFDPCVLSNGNMKLLRQSLRLRKYFQISNQNLSSPTLLICLLFFILSSISIHLILHFTLSGVVCELENRRICLRRAGF